MSSSLLKYLSLGIGSVSVILSVLYTNEATQFVKPFFHIGIYLFYYSHIRKFHAPLLLFLSLGLIAEFLTASGFELHYAVINVLFTGYFALGTWMILPVLKNSVVKLKWKELLATIIVTGIMLYIIYAFIYYSMLEFQQGIPTVLGGLAFVAFVGSCFYATLFHRHPHRIYLFLVGIGYLLVCLGYLVYELLLPSSLLMGVINASEIMAQFSFVCFMIDRHEMLQKIKWYI